jgi:hypothetical protein
VKIGRYYNSGRQEYFFFWAVRMRNQFLLPQVSVSNRNMRISSGVNPVISAINSSFISLINIDFACLMAVFLSPSFSPSILPSIFPSTLPFASPVNNASSYTPGECCSYRNDELKNLKIETGNCVNCWKV